MSLQGAEKEQLEREEEMRTTRSPDTRAQRSCSVRIGGFAAGT